MKTKQRGTWFGVGMITLAVTAGCGTDGDELFSSRASATPNGTGGSTVASAPDSPGVPAAAAMPSPNAPPTRPDVEGVAPAPTILAPTPPAPETSNGDPGAEEPPPPSPEPATEPEPPQPPCELSEFGPLEKISGLGLSGPVWGPALSAADTGLFLVLTTDGGAEQIFFASRSDVTSAQFSAANPVFSLGSSAFDGTPFVSTSGLRIYFYSTREESKSGSRDLWVAERSGPVEAFGAPSPLVELNTAGLEVLPRLSADELSIVFTSDRPDGRGRTDIWQARRSSADSPFDEPENLAELNTDSDDTGALISSDGLTVFFSSNRAGGQGRLDIWRATRTSSDQPFDPPLVMPVVNSPSDELDLALSSNERELLLSSDRDGVPELWRSVRACR